MRNRFLFGLGLALTLGGASASEAASYKLDAARSQLVVLVYKDGVASSLAHDHVIQATQFSGNVSYDAAAVSSASIRVTANTSSLKADAPALRKQFKLTSELSEDDRATVETNMKAADQLDVARFATIEFQSVEIKAGEGGTVQVRGDLTLHGVKRSVQFPAQVSVDGTTFKGSARVTLKQSDFGFQPYSALFGAIRNKDEVVLDLKIVAPAE